MSGMDIKMNGKMTVPAGKVLIEAMETNKRLGHENLGFLSDTRGMLPLTPPLLSLPSAYAIWDEIAAELPDLCRRLSVRKRLDAMPLLPADNPQTLPDSALLRASVIISALAHAYYYIGIAPPENDVDGLPQAILMPWQHIAQRLKRLGAHMSYIDMSSYNWRLRDENYHDPISVENLDLLAPTWGTEAERIFIASTIEIADKSRPLILGIVEAQNAILRDEPDRLESALCSMIESLNKIAQNGVPKISASYDNPFFVEPVVWAKTVSPLSGSIRKGAAGPVGAATLSFQALDAFLEREKYQSGVGGATLLAREWYPQHWRNFYDASTQISASGYINAKANPVLKNLLEELLDAYAGDSGYLGRHRLKSYGYMETAFKCGRGSTAAFKGSFEARSWDEVDKELRRAQQERYSIIEPKTHIHYAQVRQVTALTEKCNIFRVDLEFGENAVRYQAGDRCAILPENSADIVTHTLQALRASGDELVELDDIWREAIQYRAGYGVAETHLPLRQLLRFGKLRPLTREIAQRLHQRLDDPTLAHILSTHTEHQWELGEVIESLSKFQPLTVNALYAGKAVNGHEICRIILPESYRLYSISSHPANGKESRQLQLTIGNLKYSDPSNTTKNSARKIRHGAASNFLTSNPAGKITAKIIPSAYFRLPRDNERPIIMFGAGTGISPFIGMIKARINSGSCAENWLFFSVQTSADFFYRKELTQWVAQGKLRLTMIFTREDAEAVFVADPALEEGGKFIFGKAPRRRIDDAIREAGNAGHLQSLLADPQRPDGKGAYLYACGQTGFAMAVKQGLQHLFEENAPVGQDPQVFSTRRMESLAAMGHYRQETFTPDPNAQINLSPENDTGNYFHISDVALHNNDEQGYWLVIDDSVYDVSAYGHEHPGGFKILKAYAGIDATAAYRKVGHHQNSEIQAMLSAYQIGVLHPLTHMRESPGLRSLFRDWVKYLHLIVEIENALINDFSFQREIATAGETAERIIPSPAKLMFYLKSHQRFLHELLPQIIGDNLWKLWRSTVAPDTNMPDLRGSLTGAMQGFPAHSASEYQEYLIEELKCCIACEDNPENEQVLQHLQAQCSFFETEDYRLLQQIKAVICRIIQRFERLLEYQNESGFVTVKDRDDLHQSLQFFFKRLAAKSSNQNSAIMRKLA